MKKLIAANWKMNKNVKDSVSAIKELKKLLKNKKNIDVVVCPTFTSLQAAAKELKGSNVRLGAQNMHFEESGAFTGEISAGMLKDAGCEYVILGHSERREFFGEDNATINKKIITALSQSLSPILCIGENLEQRRLSRTKDVLENQLRMCLRNVSKRQILKINIAYEPIWAISRGDPNHKSATAEDAEDGHILIRKIIEKIFDKSTAKNLRVIYGGSMKPENAQELLRMPNIDGGLVGNASLNAKSFAEIVNSAE